MGHDALRASRRPALRHAATIVTFEPGGLIPFEETHVMEHGLDVIEGEAVDRLNRDRMEVEAGSFMWLRALCPRACYAGGPARADRREGTGMYDAAVLWDWLAFAVRWLHVMTAIAWIGSLFYYVALDLGLRRTTPDLPACGRGEEWQGGASTRKRQTERALGARRLPRRLMSK